MSDISLKNKLILMQVFTCMIVLGLCVVVFVITDIRDYKTRKVNSINAIAQVIGSNSISSLEFLDNKSATEILSDLSVEPDILNASIFDKNGIVFARFTKHGSDTFHFSLPASNGRQYEFMGTELFVFNPILKNNKPIGTVAIQVNLSNLEKIIGKKLQLAAIVLIIGIGLAFLIAIIIQRYVSNPLLRLVSVMKKVKGSKDYKSRAIVTGKDEINTLSSVFNDMLEQIEKRDIELESRVKERTSELETANKELESFSYSVSHDLRAPLRSISGFSSLLQKNYAEGLDNEGKELVNFIVSNAKNMEKLIEDLLAFSRLGRKEIQKSTIDMTLLAKEATEEVLKSAEEKYEAQLIIDNLPDADGDSALIKQVFINLVSNALKYSRPKPKPVVHIGSYSKEGEIIYYVKDNGVGFDMNYYHKLFGVFQRLHNQNEFKGIGIGLAIVQRIVSRHEGRVWAESILNEGSTFYFSLPASKPA